MTRKQEFLRDLERLCKKYDFGTHEAEICLNYDGPDVVIEVDLPSEDGWENFTLSYRPYWEEVA